MFLLGIRPEKICKSLSEIEALLILYYARTAMALHYEDLRCRY